MGLEHAVRRVIHLCTPAFLVYYLLPDEIVGVDKRFGLVLIMVLTLWIDGLRIIKGLEVPGARPYEKRRISSTSWAGFGLMLAFMLFPEHFVVPVVFGMAWVDPLMGEVRKRNDVNPVLIGAPLCALIFACASVIFFPGSPLPLVIASTPIAALSAALVEHYGPEWLDDDLSMVIVPLLLLYPIGMAFG
jgi:hypothetical protein